MGREATCSYAVFYSASRGCRHEYLTLDGAGPSFTQKSASTAKTSLHTNASSTLPRRGSPLRRRDRKRTAMESWSRRPMAYEKASKRNLEALPRWCCERGRARSCSVRMLEVRSTPEVE